MNISTVIVLIVIFAAFALAVWRVMKKGVPCSCGSKDCKNCACCCNKNKENNKVCCH